MYVYQRRNNDYIFLYVFKCTCHEIVSSFKDEDVSTAIFIEPNDGYASDEDSADENDGGLLHNLPQSQINAPGEALVSDGRRKKFSQTDRSNKAIDAEQIYKEPNWKRDILLP